MRALELSVALAGMKILEAGVPKCAPAEFRSLVSEADSALLGPNVRGSVAVALGENVESQGTVSEQEELLGGEGPPSPEEKLTYDEEVDWD